MQIHYGAVRREPWMSARGRWMLVDNQRVCGVYVRKPTRATVIEACAGMAHADVLRIVDVVEHAHSRAR